MTDISTILTSLHAARSNPTEAGRLLEDLVEVDDAVVATLIAALDSPEPEVRSGAALALGYLPLYSDGKLDVAPALPVLLRSANDDDSWVAFHAAKSLWSIEVEHRGIDGLSQEAVTRVTTFLTNPEPGLRIAAAEQLRLATRFPNLTVPSLITALDDPVIGARCAAADALSSLGPIAVGAMPKLMTWTNNNLPEERFFGSAAAMAIDSARRAALAPVLMAALEQLDGKIRIKAFYALGRRIETANQAVPLLARLYRESQDHELRLAVICVLAGFGPDVQDALPILIEAVRDPDREVAAAAARGLGAWGPASAEAASALIELLDAEVGEEEPSDRQDRDLREELIDVVRSALEGIGVMAGTASKGAKRTDSKRIDA